MEEEKKYKLDPTLETKKYTSTDGTVRYMKDGKLHKINRGDGINMGGPKPRPTWPTPPQPTEEELQQQQRERRKALHLNYLQQQRLRAQIAATKTKRIKFINDSTNIQLDSHVTTQFFKLIGK